MYEPTNELRLLAETVAAWADSAPSVPTVYLFGSRVRGDHQPSSDVDVCLMLSEWGATEDCIWWWAEQNETDFASLKGGLPGKLSIHRDEGDKALEWVKEARADPRRIVLTVRKVTCVWTEPKPSRVASSLDIGL